MKHHLDYTDFGCDSILPFDIFFFSRLGGHSKQPFDSLNISAACGDDPKDAGANEATALDIMGVSRLYLPRQIHSAQAIFVDEAMPTSASREMEADAITTAALDVAVGVLTADCVPILIGHRDGKAVSAVHAGWRGMLGGVIGSAVAALQNQGLDSRDLIAFVGPAIGPCCFEVGQEVVAEFQQGFGKTPSVICESGGRTTLDLPAAAGARLADAGLESDAIHLARRCTACERESFFSYRRDQGKTGRQLSAIVIKSDKLK
jgi:purine-nucleoside/S-methyl-5'-thioadenosine phosphorylase / adenosine deaminase